MAIKFVSDLAFDFRQQFGRDVVIDMYSYRRYGHNEGDEPSFTQPDLYAKIEKRPSVTQLYKRELLEAGTLSEDDAASLETEFALRLEMTRDEVSAIEKRKASEKARFKESTAIFQPEYTSTSEPTSITEKTLRIIVDGLTRIPEGFEVQPKIKRIVLDHQRKVFEEGGPYEWHYAEALAFGSLLLEGIPVRLSGQDSSRGTFSTRHSVLYDAKTGRPYVPLMHLAEKQARICIYNSPLSEAAVLGFDYGYSLDYPKMLCLWKRSSAILRMPRNDHRSVHRLQQNRNGSGPAALCCYSRTATRPGPGTFQRAARERFLQSVPRTTSGVQSHHRRPVFSCVTTPDETRLHQTAHHYDSKRVYCAPSSRRRLRKNSSMAGSRKFSGAPEAASADKVKRIIFCSGKVYYDLLKYRTEREVDDAAIIRIEQLYPLTEKAARNAQAVSKNALKLVGARKNRKTWGRGLSSSHDCARSFAAKSPTRDATPAPARLSAH